MTGFRDRVAAGRSLVEPIAELHLDRPLVLGLPRGGVPVAAEVAAALGAELDVFVSRKVGLPRQPDLGIGALSEGGALVSDPDMRARLGVSDAQFELLVEEQAEEVQRRVDRYRSGRALPELAGRNVVVVDDGLATGVTAEAALVDLRARAPASLTLAVPVGASQAIRRLAPLVDHIVCPLQPDAFDAVSTWYERFDQTGDDEVIRILSGT